MNKERVKAKDNKNFFIIFASLKKQKECHIYNYELNNFNAGNCILF